MSPPDVMIIGLDGVPFNLLTSLCEEGVCPTLSGLLQRGTGHPIRSSIPDVSSAAWTTFMTGTNPGTHGIYGFFVARRENYALRFLSAADIQAPVLWEQLNRLGKRCLVVNVPQTYPAIPLDGVMISGFVTPDLRKGVYPPSLFPELSAQGYQVDVDAWKAREDMGLFLSQLFSVLHKRKDTVLQLLREDRWDVATIVFTGTDRLQHYLWDGVTTASHPWHSKVMEFYTAVDAAIADILKFAGQNTTIILLSDHGFTSVEAEVNLNAWFRELGILHFGTEFPESLGELDAEKSVAFALDPGRIYLNRNDRFDSGWIRRADIPAYRQELRDILESELTIRSGTGHRRTPVERVCFPEEIYSGDQLSEAPDLIVIPKEGVDLKGSVQVNEVSRRDVLTGVHTREDAIFLTQNLPAGIDVSNIRSLEHISALVLELVQRAEGKQSNNH